MGDSFTEAWGVPFEKGYTQLLTDMLNKQSHGIKYEAIVCGKWGWNSKHN